MKSARLGCTFKRKREETPHEALERLERVLVRCKKRIQQWIVYPTVYGIRTTHAYEERLKFILQMKAILLGEIEERHNALIGAFPEANVISIERNQYRLT